MLNNKDLEFPSDSNHAIEFIRDEESLTKTINQYVKEADDKKRPRALQWFTNSAFSCGNHYVQYRWDGNTLTGTTPSIPSHKLDSYIPRTADNKLLRPIAVNTSLLTENKPVPRVEPNSTDPRDDDAAELSRVVFNLLWETPLDMQCRLRELADILCIQGTAAIEIEYGPTDIPIRVPELKETKAKNPLTGEDEIVQILTGKDTIEMKEDIQCNIWNAFQLDFNLDATDDPNSITMICRSSFEDITWIKRRFNKKAPEYLTDNLENLQPGKQENSPLWFYERQKEFLDSPFDQWIFSGGGSNVSNNQTILKVFDCKPNEEFPEGRTLVMAGDVLIYAGPARAWSEKYPERWHPYSFFKFWKSPGKPFGRPLLTPLIPLQRKINAIDAILQINREYLSLGQWLVPTTSKVPDGYLGGLPGIQIPYRPSATGARPEKIPHQPLPSDVYLERNQLVSAIDAIAGVNLIPALDQVKGPGTSNIRANSMLASFRRELMKAQSSMLQDFEKALERVAQNILIEVSLRMEDPNAELAQRIAVAAREFSSWSVEAFTGRDLRDNVNIKLDITSAIYESPEAKAENALRYLQYSGGNLSEAERVKIAKSLGLQEFDLTRNPQYERAKRMVARVVSGNIGEVVPMEEIDNAAIFIEVITNELLKDRIIDLPKERKEALFALLDRYKQMLAQEQMQQLQQMLQLQQLQAGQSPAQKPPAKGVPVKKEAEVPPNE